MNPVSDTFCIIPWVGATVAPNQENLICCRSKGITNYTLDSVNTEDHKKLRDALDKGIKHDICERCWQDEKFGIHSYRELYNDRFKDLIASDAYSPPVLRFLEYTPSNVCNLACRMCSSRYSSKIVAREKYLSSLGIWYDAPKTTFTNWKDLDLTQLEELKMMGGEPMHMKEHLEILEYLDSIGNLKNMELSLITNCTMPLTDKWKYFLTKAKKCYITLSIDAVGKLNEYLRQYSEWNTIVKNLEDFKEFRKNNSSIHLNINSAVSIFNINKTKELVDYFTSHEIHIYLNPVMWPEQQSVCNLSDDRKKLLLDNPGVSEKVKHLLTDKISFWDQNINNDESFNHKIIAQLEAMDSLYSKHLKDYNKEIYDILYKKV